MSKELEAYNDRRDNVRVWAKQWLADLLTGDKAVAGEQVSIDIFTADRTNNYGYRLHGNIRKPIYLSSQSGFIKGFDSFFNDNDAFYGITSDGWQFGKPLVEGNDNLMVNSGHPRKMIQRIIGIKDRNSAIAFKLAATAGHIKDFEPH